jgi:Domain of unknown function (DUF4382)/Domain of unknown function (DUF5666)
MLRRIAAWGVLMGLVASLGTGCGGSTKLTTPVNGGVVTLLSDSPYCDIVSFRTALTEYVLIPADGSNGISPYATAPNILLDMSELRDFSTILNVTPVPENTYNQIEVSLGLTDITFFDPTLDPPFTSISATLSNAKFRFPISPPLVVTGNKVSALQLDFDMRRSVTLDAQGQVTANVNPVMRARPIVSTAADGFGRLEDVVGFVRTVLTTSTVAGTTGGFGIQTMGSSGVYLIAYVNSDTQFYGLDALNHLTTGTFAEVNGYVDTNGNFIARSVEFEAQEDTSTNTTGFVGMVTSLTRDSSGNATGLKLFVRDEAPEIPAVVPLDSVAGVSFSDSTTYQYSSRFANFASLPFDATGLAVGQIVIVHGTATAGDASTTPVTPPTVAATAVYLKLQTQAGNFSSLVSVGSDDKTGAFYLAPCATVFQGTPILVITNNQTTYTNLSGLTSLTPQPSLLIKGLLFYEQKAQTINGIPVPAGTLVMLANEVHQVT